MGCSKLSMLLVAMMGLLLQPDGVSANSIQLTKQTSKQQLPDATSSITVYLFDSETATSAIAIEVYFPGEWSSDEQGESGVISVTFDDSQALAGIPELWMEMEVDGNFIDDRIEIATPGVTFGSGNNLNMSGNAIIDVASPVVASDAATKGYVDSANSTGNSATATALLADGTNCPAGQYSLGIDAGGNAQGCTTNATTASALAADGTNCPAGQFALGVDASGSAQGCSIDQVGSGDNFGNHQATANLQLGSNWLSGDGADEGIQIDAAGKVGVGTAPGSADLNVGGIDGVLFQGVNGSGTIPAEGGGTRFMWYPGKAALRAGIIANAEWNDENVGSGSVAFGVTNTASGQGSVAMGQFNTVSGIASAAIGHGLIAGYNTQFVVGQYNKASVSGVNPLFVVGNGPNGGSKSNALIVRKDGSLEISGEITRTGEMSWVAPTLLNSWVNNGNSHATAGYRKMPDGRIEIKGVIKSGVLGVPIFQLASGYRPSEIRIFSVNSDDAFGSVNIYPDGNVTLWVGGNAFLTSLEISFYP